MAPEQLNLKKYGFNNRIHYNLDLWSLGVTIYEVLAGRLLFKNNDEESSEQIMANIMAPELPQKINDLPEPFRKVVFQCVVKNAKERAQTVEELVKLLNSDDLNPLLPASAVESNTSRPSTESRRPTAIISRPEGRELRQEVPGSNTQKLAPQVSFSDEQNDVPSRARSSRKSAKPIDYLKQQRARRFALLAILIGLIVAGVSLFMWNNRPKFVSPDPSQITHAATPPDLTDSIAGKKEIKNSSASIGGKDKEGGNKANATQNPPNDADDQKPSIAVHHAKLPENNTAVRHDPRNTPLPTSRKDMSTEMVLGVTSNRICKVEIRSVSSYWVTSEPNLGVGEKLKVYLKPGKYFMTATSLASDSSKKTASIEVRPDDVGTNRPYKIDFN